MVQSKWMFVWLAALLALAGIYVSARSKPRNLNARLAANDTSSEAVKPIAVSASIPEASLALGAAMPHIGGTWITSDGGAQAPELAGQVVLLDFWSTFCAPCIAAIPENNRTAEKYAAHGFVLAGVAPESHAALLDFKKSVDVRYPLLAADKATFPAFNIEFTPSAFLFDRAGKLIWKGASWVNAKGVTDAEFERVLTLALAAPTVSPSSSAEAAASTLPPEFQKLMEQAKADRAASTAAGTVEEEIGLKLGAPLPELKGEWSTPRGRPPELKNKVLLIDFFTTVCGSCVESIPSNNELAKNYAPQGFIFAFVSPESTSLVNDFREDFAKKIEYPVLTNASTLFDLCDVKVLPTTLLFGRNGKLVWKGGSLHKGGKLDPDFESALNAALKTQ